MKPNMWLSALTGILLSGMSVSLAAIAEELNKCQPLPTQVEAHEVSRLLIENRKGGEIKGSRDEGKSWKILGHVEVPNHGVIWEPTQNGNGVLAYNFLRGPSNVFATAVNAVHLRLSDPVGYELPKDPKERLVIPHGISIAPKETRPVGDIDEKTNHTIYTDILGGTAIFGAEWSPKVADQVLMGDGVTFKPIPYDQAPTDLDLMASQILIITHEKASGPIQYLDFENKAQGKVILKTANEPARQVAKVTQAVEGVGRFSGSEFLPKPGTIRANHAGVLDVGTTDINVDPVYAGHRPSDPAAIIELRGGFQIVPSHHYKDESMNSGNDHPFVYMVVGPIIDPPNLDRYDMGIEGTYPLFNGGLRGGEGVTCFKFKGSPEWIELTDAVKAGKFKTKDGTVLSHLRGYVRDALIEVTDIRVLR